MNLIVFLWTGFCLYWMPSETTETGDRAAKENPAGIEFIYIQGGTFKMGDVFGNGMPEENPVHEVTVSDFYLGKTEVTVLQFRTFCKAAKRPMPQEPDWGWHDDHPVVNVSWTDAEAFCDWARCRLPTEAEWEYAARNRGDSDHYSFGDSLASGQILGNIRDTDEDGLPVNRYRGFGDSFAFTAPAAGFLPNKLGLYDMTGNVWEWCSDWYARYDSHSQTNPQGPAGGTHKVLRGGSWINDPGTCRTTSRFKNYPANYYDCYGFRVAKSKMPGEQHGRF